MTALKSSPSKARHFLGVSCKPAPSSDSSQVFIYRMVRREGLFDAAVQDVMAARSQDLNSVGAGGEPRSMGFTCARFLVNSSPVDSSEELAASSVAAGAGAGPGRAD